MANQAGTYPHSVAEVARSISNPPRWDASPMYVTYFLFNFPIILKSCLVYGLCFCSESVFFSQVYVIKNNVGLLTYYYVGCIELNEMKVNVCFVKRPELHIIKTEL